MAITADQERELLNRYHLNTLYPTEWPQGADGDGEESSEEDAPKPATRHLRSKSNVSTNSRFQKIDRHASLKSSLSGKQSQADAGVQKDEPDALGMAPSVAAELRRRGLPVEDNISLRNKFMLSSTSFSPALYLSQVHQNASTEDLLRGLDFLSKSIEQKSASLKVLVESNFERFVRAKATIDTVYTEMRTQGVEENNNNNKRLSQVPAGAAGSLRPHSRHASRNQSHFRNMSGPFSSQSKVAAMQDKKKTALTKESEYGVQGIKGPLQEIAIKAEEVWGPALGGHEKEETLKAVTTAIDQHKDVFRLSGVVYESIKKNDYDGVVDAYKQARQHADKARRIAEIAKQNQVALGDSDVHQIIITAKMWHDVEMQIDEFKYTVWRRLKTAHGRKPAAVTDESDKEEHMELIGLLMQLGVDENPIWEWINSRYLYLKNRIARSFERSRIETEIMRRRLANTSRPDAVTMAKHLRSASNATGILRLAKESTRDMDTPAVIALWEKVQSSLAALLSLQTGVLGEVVEWWETAQSFIDNKAQKAFPTAVFAAGLEHLELDPDHVQNIRSGAVELVHLIRECVISFFSDPPVEDLSDLYSPIPPTPITPDSAKPFSPGTKRALTFDANNVPPPSPKRGDPWEKFAFWPPNANSLSGSFYLSRCLALVGIAAGEMANLSIIKQANESERLKTLVTTVRERCITAIHSSWGADAEKCKVLESWQRSPDRRDLTLMPVFFEAWEEKVLANVQKIAYVSDAAATAKGADVIIPPPAKLLQSVRSCFVTSLYKALSGMVENAEKRKEEDAGDADPDGVTLAKQGVVADGAVTEIVDASNRNVRMLLTLSNLGHLRSETIPQLISHFETAFSVKLTEEGKTIRDVLGQIDARLFQSYVLPTVDTLANIITSGIASPSWVPAGSARPTDAAPYIYDVLLTLVLVHSEVTSTSPSSPLTNQILSYLLEQCSAALLTAFKTRAKYSLTALMQATLDVEFLAQTLNQYTTDKAGEMQSQIYVELDSRTEQEARQALQGELPEMRAVLKRLREGTKGEFGCFKRERRGRGATTTGSR